MDTVSTASPGGNRGVRRAIGQTQHRCAQLLCPLPCAWHVGAQRWTHPSSDTPGAQSLAKVSNRSHLPASSSVSYWPQILSHSPPLPSTFPCFVPYMCTVFCDSLCWRLSGLRRYLWLGSREDAAQAPPQPPGLAGSNSTPGRGCGPGVGTTPGSCLVPAGWGIRSKPRGPPRVQEQVRVQDTGLRALRGREGPQKLRGLPRRVAEATGSRSALGRHEASGSCVSCRRTCQVDFAAMPSESTAPDGPAG